mmetsp:Transcript_8357/g.18190  ORF Transcript_8357/g.18190 Transcript_8357/m.18190 type:complete len:272 (-) Transcript_8357:393-1208(-)
MIQNTTTADASAVKNVERKDISATGNDHARVANQRKAVVVMTIAIVLRLIIAPLLVLFLSRQFLALGTSGTITAVAIGTIHTMGKATTVVNLILVTIGKELGKEKSKTESAVRGRRNASIDHKQGRTNVTIAEITAVLHMIAVIHAIMTGEEGSISAAGLEMNPAIVVARTIAVLHGIAVILPILIGEIGSIVTAGQEMNPAITVVLKQGQDLVEGTVRKRDQDRTVGVGHKQGRGLAEGAAQKGGRHPTEDVIAVKLVAAGMPSIIVTIH